MVFTAFGSGMYSRIPHSDGGDYNAVQIQNAVCAYFTIEQILPFAFAKQYKPTDARYDVPKLFLNV